MNYADLEIGLSRRDAHSYTIELRYNQPDDVVDHPPERGSFNLPLAELQAKLLNPQAYGKLLTESLLGEVSVRNALQQFNTLAQGAGGGLRLRLLVDRSAPELHDLRWETLRNLDDSGFLASDQNLLFSRYLHSYDWTPVRRRSRGELRALVVVANPTDLEDQEYEVGGKTLAAVDVDGELQRARDGLKRFPLTELASDPNDPGRASLERIVEHLRRGYDIIYLACHGALWQINRLDPNSPREPFLLLEKPDGASDEVRGLELVRLIRELPADRRPRLVVLASCQSAGVGQPAQSVDQGALAGLGPRLSQAGVPAVVAMQGNVLMDTVARFMPVFFTELDVDGLVDRAMAAARAAISAQADWWVPVLFLRLRAGELWYVPRFATDKQEFELWPGLVNSLKKKQCTPILGYGLLESLSGSTHEIARRWGEDNQYPLEPYSLESLPNVAQYLANRHGPAFPRDQLLDHLKSEMVTRFAGELPADARKKSLSRLITIVGEKRRKANADDPYRILASLDCPIYILATPDNLLQDALVEAERLPVVDFVRWKASLTSLPSFKDNEPTYMPSVERPFVYHLFGKIDEPDSLVLSEDDFFDYLMWVNRSDNPVPLHSAVDRAWSLNALLFLGFQTSDWEFRVLFRSILTENRRFMPKNYKSVAVQIEPDENLLHPGRASRYLQELFIGANFGVYWGGADDFLKQLWAKWQEQENDD